MKKEEEKKFWKKEGGGFIVRSDVRVAKCDK